jgi:hypothetical protein
MARRRVLVATGAGVTAVALGMAWVLWPRSARRAYALAPESILPPDIARAPAHVREAYRFAVANRDTLRFIPCFCGCGAERHASNASCYVTDDSTAADVRGAGAAPCGA